MGKMLSLFGGAVLKVGTCSMLLSGICTLAVFTPLAVFVALSGDLVALGFVVFMVIVGLVHTAVSLKHLRKPKTNIEEVR